MSVGRSVGRSSDCRLQCLIKLLLLFMLAKTERRSVLGYNRVVHPTFTTGWLAGWLVDLCLLLANDLLLASLNGRAGGDDKERGEHEPSLFQC